MQCNRATSPTTTKIDGQILHHQLPLIHASNFTQTSNMKDVESVTSIEFGLTDLDRVNYKAHPAYVI